ncbi:PAPA-1-like conserved region-domain-containing protein [Flagelloscypha sp. PMI_526]|nr:PAPA-1-like conserved region-domain-containing protein [Flagelloscypha sp. PMI_526]
MTARQARLHGAGESTELLSLNDEDGPYAKKKKILTETEVALRREETARKRKNLSEKKLEDEKAETINRLLKKQTRPRGRRPAVSNEDKQAEDDDEEGSAPPPPPPIPTMYRWPEGTEDSPQSSDRPMAMSFSVPYSAFSNVTPSSQEGELPLLLRLPNVAGTAMSMGATGARKYRLVKDWNLGACSMPHLKQLELIS